MADCCPNGLPRQELGQTELTGLTRDRIASWARTAEILLTDEEKAMEPVSDGQRLKVQTQR
jgi:hypothetical protein